MSKQVSVASTSGEKRMSTRSDHSNTPGVRNYYRLYIKTRKIQYFFIMSEDEDEESLTPAPRRKVKKILKNSLPTKKGKKRGNSGKFKAAEKAQKKKRLLDSEAPKEGGAPKEEV